MLYSKVVLAALVGLAAAAPQRGGDDKPKPPHPPGPIHEARELAPCQVDADCRDNTVCLKVDGKKVCAAPGHIARDAPPPPPPQGNPPPHGNPPPQGHAARNAPPPPPPAGKPPRPGNGGHAARQAPPPPPPQDNHPPHGHAARDAPPPPPQGNPPPHGNPPPQGHAARDAPPPPPPPPPHGNPPPQGHAARDAPLLLPRLASPPPRQWRPRRSPGPSPRGVQEQQGLPQGPEVPAGRRQVDLCLRGSRHAALGALRWHGECHVRVSGLDIRF
ncbi:hypothetical protein N3K66_007962 [Trichothecium roseum]|uniref:Uncharacterized protein n=1 Tax=Trichothecium roseum TaxID=47278 RepID=A0ACC0UT97_9HYPO|nr:hypothetical protein N3K66_007962 [Trichothecium roseum]